MVHYPFIMSQIGPLRQTWAMRFEAKHQVFKRCARVSFVSFHLPPKGAVDYGKHSVK